MRALLLTLAFLLPTPDAEACSCVARTFAQHAKAEQLVVIARAGKPEKTGTALTQTFTVLATLKGKPAPTFVLARPAPAPCTQDYAENEVAILFTSSGDLDPCHGNMPLATQLEDLPAIAAAAGTKRGVAKLEAIEVALRQVLPPFLHDRAEVHVALAALAGKTIQVGKTKLMFAATAKRKEVWLQAFSAGDITFVAGTYGTEGVKFSVLVHGGQVIGSSVAET